jgi:hypothetical protein
MIYQRKVACGQKSIPDWLLGLNGQSLLGSSNVRKQLKNVNGKQN